MITYNPLLCLDFYKTCHAEQYPKGLTKMVSYYTPRMSRLGDTDKVTLFGLQAFIQEYLIEAFKGYKVLNPHVKAIYGDSITPQRCEQIYSLLEKNGFAINNVSLGVGSFSMECLETIEYDGSKQYNPYTRDTFGIAVKATYAEDADGKPIMIFKNPKTDTGHFKKSQRGCCRVVKTDDGYDYVDGLTWAEAQDSNELRTVFRDGKFEKQFTLDEVRKNLHGGTF